LGKLNTARKEITQETKDDIKTGNHDQQHNYKFLASPGCRN